MKMKRIVVLLAFALAAPMALPVNAADTSPAAPTVQMQAAQGHLGVLIGSVPDALRAQLSHVLPVEQGVLILNVERDSAAAKAGLKDYDVLIGYGDQKLYSADQLSRMVRADRPGHKVELRVVRAGAVQKIEVTLGRAMPEAACPVGHMPWHHHHFHPMANMQPQGKSDWKAFDSLSLRKLKDGKYRAEIRYLGKDGKMVERHFTGKRSELRKQIVGQKNLPAAERDRLLSVLNVRGGAFPFGTSVPWACFHHWHQWHPGY